MQVHASGRSAFTLVEIMIVVAIIGLLASIAIPSFVKAQGVAKRTGCIANLKAIEGVKGTWALETRRNDADTPTDADLFGPTSYIRDKPQCPANGTYSLNAVEARPTCTVPSHAL